MAVMYVDGRPKWYDPDINWHDIHQQEFLSRLAAVPFFEEAGSLLQSAACLWPGRVRAGELAGLGQQLADRGREWRRSALGWSDAAIKVRHRNLERERVLDAAGPVLATYRDVRRHMRAYGAPKPLPHDAAALRLVGAALALMEDAVPIVGNTGQKLYRVEEAEHLQDQIEVLREVPRLESAPRPSVAGLRAIKFRAVSRVCDGLCYTAAQVFRNSYGRTGQDSAAADLWYARAAAFERRWNAEYVRFLEAETADADERAALMAACDEASPYTHCLTDSHYAGEETKARAAGVIDGLVRLLCRAAQTGFGAEAPPESPGEIPDLLPELLLPA